MFLLIRPSEVSILFGLSGVSDAKWRKASASLSNAALACLPGLVVVWVIVHSGASGRGQHRRQHRQLQPLPKNSEVLLR